MKKVTVIILTLAALLLGTSPLDASSFNFKVGLFSPAMESDLWEINMDNLALEKQDMQAGYYAIEYEYSMSPNLTFSIEGGVYKKEHYSMYRYYEYDDGTPIYQNVGLRITSLELSFKYYPMGLRQKLFPFVGAGAGVYRWQYEQWGDFIDVVEGVVNEDEYVEASAYDIGFNARAGIGIRLGRSTAVSFEARYQYLKGDLGPFFEDFERLDMNGLALVVGVNFLFR
jgi:outer membrane protein W